VTDCCRKAAAAGPECNPIAPANQSERRSQAESRSRVPAPAKAARCSKRAPQDRGSAAPSRPTHRAIRAPASVRPVQYSSPPICRGPARQRRPVRSLQRRRSLKRTQSPRYSRLKKFSRPIPIEQSCIDQRLDSERVRRSPNRQAPVSDCCQPQLQHCGANIHVCGIETRLDALGSIFRKIPHAFRAASVPDDFSTRHPEGRHRLYIGRLPCALLEDMVF